MSTHSAAHPAKKEDIRALEASMQRWLFGAILAIPAATFALMKLFP